MERRLAAILAADMAGYSRLVRADEEGTIGAMKMLLSERLEPIITDNRGRIVKLMGDGILAQFASAWDAVRAAVAVQESIAAYNADLPEDRKTLFRIGINLGDVIVDGDDIHGDGVNLASRLESLAEPGGICISEKVYEEIRDRTDLPFRDIGPQAIKNIDRPVRVWQWPASVELTRTPPDVPLARDKPSIAVLPFDNMSGDPDQEYFADGLTEDIITGLARFHNLSVIARHSTFTYKGRPMRMQDIARDLGVQYLVEGSVRKSGSRVRVTAQLIEAGSENHVWAERYDRDLDDIFVVQDAITQAIVSTLPGRLEDASWEKVKRKPPSSMTAYDYLLLGRERFNRFTRPDNAEARRMFQAAIELDPLYARAHAHLASTHLWDIFMYAASDQSLDLALASAESAQALDDEDSWSHAMLGYAHFLRKEDDAAEIEFRRSVWLNPNDADTIAFLANALIYFGRWSEALERIFEAKRLNPFPPAYYHWYHGLALYSARRYEEAISAIRQIRNLDRWHRGLLAMCQAQLNRLDEARPDLAFFSEARRRELRERGAAAHATDLEIVADRVNRYRLEADRDHFLEGLRKAGLEL